LRRGPHPNTVATWRTSMPHLDRTDIVTRAYVAEQARKARIAADREANAARIRESIEHGTAGVGGRPKSIHCGICGSPQGDRTAPRNACPACSPRLRQIAGREKLSHEELYPESTNEYEEA